jgi:RNA polymerase sigma-70 factor (ECF subfamily)
MKREQIIQWYEKYGPMVFRRCRQLLTDEASARDAVQEVFVRILRNTESIIGEYPSSLLYRTATNVCLNMIRSTKRKKETDWCDTVLEVIACRDDTLETFTTRSLLDRIFSREEPSTRVMATYHFVDGLTLEETAAEMEMSVSGVRRRLRRLKERLQETQTTQEM